MSTPPHNAQGFRRRPTTGCSEPPIRVSVAIVAFMSAVADPERYAASPSVPAPSFPRAG